jgi:3-dehydroquinate synthetase
MLSELLARNLRIKGDIVARDVTERSGPRLWLNFGHTIGHAIETCDDYALRHGECVSLGMAAACRLGESLDLHGSSLTGRVSALLTKFGLPIQLASPLDLDQALAVMRLDKKSLGPDLRFVFLEDIGKPVVKTVTDLTLIRAALESLVK